MKDTMTLKILRILRESGEPMLVRDIATQLGKDVKTDDLHPVRQVLNHLSRKEDGVTRADTFGSFRYYQANDSIDQAIARRGDPKGYGEFLDRTGS